MEKKISCNELYIAPQNENRMLSFFFVLNFNLKGKQILKLESGFSTS